MKKLKFKFENENLELFADDIQKIVDAFAKRGYEITPSDACRAWEAEIEAINKKIDDFNLKRPAYNLELFKLRFDEELKRVDAQRYL